VTDLTTVISDDRVVNITWTAPYSIDVPSTDPDITYCVDVFNTSTSVPSKIYSQCGINEAYHEIEYYPLLIACTDYKVEVIAENKVGNSTTKMKQVLKGGK